MRVLHRKISWLVSLAVVLSLISAGFAQSSLPAFPGAEGYGSTTRHAYGASVAPMIYRVTNLNDSGAGSLRAALTASGPRVVVFEVSGYISLSSNIGIKNPYLYVAGETAPSPGITVRNDYIYVATHDVVIRHLRIRSTNLGGSTPTYARGGLSIEQGAYNVVIDHCSVSWHTDEGLAFFHGGTRDSTYSHCIASEGLFVSQDDNGGGGLTAVGGSGTLGRVSRIKNLSAHNARRHGVFTYQNTITALVNNVNYNWGGGWDVSTGYVGTSDNGPNGPVYSAVVGNKYIRGPNAKSGTNYAIRFGIGTAGALTSASKLYKADVGLSGTDLVEMLNMAAFNPLVSTPPAELAGILDRITILPSATVEDYVLASAGARPADRDAHDLRIVNEVATRTGRIKSYTQWGEGSPGTWPPLAVNTRTLTIPANPHTVTSSGYTNLEIWLHGFAAQVEGTAVSSGPTAPTGVRITAS